MTEVGKYLLFSVYGSRLTCKYIWMLPFKISMFFFFKSVLQIVKFQSSPAKVRMMVDSHHSTPWELTFESARVRQHTGFDNLLESTFSFSITYQVALIPCRNVTLSANFSSWWKADIHSWVNLTWFLCLLAPGIWVIMNVMKVCFTGDSLMSWH